MRRASLGDLGWDFVGQGSFPRGTQADREGTGEAMLPTPAEQRSAGTSPEVLRIPLGSSALSVP